MEEEEDDLGYYPDGAKRTLTDEQIAIFRHSEIHLLLRERKLRREELSNEYASNISSAGKAENDSKEKGSSGPASVDALDSDEEGEYARFVEAEYREAEETASRKRQKTVHGLTQEFHPRTHSTRRTIREMDDATADDTVLDYGDESSEQLDATQCLKDDSKNIAIECQQPPSTKEGRPIWWPKLGS